MERYAALADKCASFSIDTK